VVVVVDVVAVDVVVVAAMVVVVVVAALVVVVTRSGLVPLSPQPRAVSTTTMAIAAVRGFPHGVPLQLSDPIMLSSAACVL
jgi:hypothetical protein